MRRSAWGRSLAPIAVWALAACGGGGGQGSTPAASKSVRGGRSGASGGREVAASRAAGAAADTGDSARRADDSAALARFAPAPASRLPLPPSLSGGGAAPTVLFIGTSLTAGLGLDPAWAYPALIQRLADSAGVPAHVVNAGLSGETTAGALRRVDWLLRGPADIVVIESGANDGLRGLEIDSTTANLRAMIRKVRAARPNARVLLTQMEAPPNLGPRYTTAFRNMFPAVAREERITLIPFLLQGVAGIEDLNQADGMHPNIEGEQIVARNVWRVLRPVLRDRGAPAGARTAGPGGGPGVR